MTSEQIYYDQINSPVGQLTLVATDDFLTNIIWNNLESNFKIKDSKSTIQSRDNPIIKNTKTQLIEYFKKSRTSFDLPLSPSGTEFQKSVWGVLSQIPYGQTICYSEQAGKLGDKKKARAVGMANGKNPIPIIIPCHRVIGKNRKLTGFAGGLDKKAYLLKHEDISF